jgi:hypothetical protein
MEWPRFLVFSQAMLSRLNKSTRVSFWAVHASNVSLRVFCWRLLERRGGSRGEKWVSSSSLRKSFSGPRSWVMPLQTPGPQAHAADPLDDLACPSLVLCLHKAVCYM